MCVSIGKGLAQVSFLPLGEGFGPELPRLSAPAVFSGVPAIRHRMFSPGAADYAGPLCPIRRSVSDASKTGATNPSLLCLSSMTATELLQRAAHYRMLALWVSDEELAKALHQLADEYQAVAAKLQEEEARAREKQAPWRRPLHRP